MIDVNPAEERDQNCVPRSVPAHRSIHTEEIHVDYAFGKTWVEWRRSASRSAVTCSLAPGRLRSRSGAHLVGLLLFHQFAAAHCLALLGSAGV